MLLLKLSWKYYTKLAVFFYVLHESESEEEKNGGKDVGKDESEDNIVTTKRGCYTLESQTLVT